MHGEVREKIAEIHINRSGRTRCGLVRIGAYCDDDSPHTASMANWFVDLGSTAWDFITYSGARKAKRLEYLFRHEAFPTAVEFGFQHGRGHHITEIGIRHRRGERPLRF